MHVIMSYFLSDSSIKKRMVSYNNLHYLLPACFACVYVSFKAPMSLYSILTATKITENSPVHS